MNIYNDRVIKTQAYKVKVGNCIKAFRESKFRTVVDVKIDLDGWVHIKYCDGNRACCRKLEYVDRYTDDWES